jgi:hypothetical protein
MKYIKWFAVLGLSIAAMSLGTPAHAAPSNVLPSPVPYDAGSAPRANVSPTAVLESYIYNKSSIGHGVISTFDGTYDSGIYDAILPPGWRTDTHFRWMNAHGVYVGPGGCVRFYVWNGADWVNRGRGEHGHWALGPYPTQGGVTRWELRNC